MRFTPLHLMLLLHYHTTPEPWPRASAPAVLEFTDDLIRMGLVEPRPSQAECEPRYIVMPRGEAYVRALCTTPLPFEHWVLPAQEERAL